jgi:hypothetical protein
VLVHQVKGDLEMRKICEFVSMFIISVLLVACSSGKAESFDVKAEQYKATKVMEGVLTSFGDQEKLADGKTSDEANSFAWEKIDKRNKGSLSKDLPNGDKQKLLYLLTLNKAEDLPSGTQANILFTHNTEIKKVTLNENKRTFIFDIVRSDFDHKLIRLEKQQGKWKINKVQDSQ